jgi:hypothetical protein
MSENSFRVVVLIAILAQSLFCVIRMRRALSLSNLARRREEGHLLSVLLAASYIAW